MRLEGMHHITMITGDARRNVDFYADVLGLRLVKQTVNFDALDAYDAPLRARHPEVPAEHAILGVEGARAYAGRELEADRELLTGTLGFTPLGTGEYRLDGPGRRFSWAYDKASRRGHQGAGTVHHIASHSRDEDHMAWQRRAAAAGMEVTPVIDRDYFKSVYFRQPLTPLIDPRAARRAGAVS